MGQISSAFGSPHALAAAVLLVLMWLGIGVFYNYSDSWQLFINTVTTILTFLAAFSIQYSQNRDTLEIKLKINALMRRHKELSDQLDEIEKSLDDE